MDQGESNGESRAALEVVETPAQRINDVVGQVIGTTAKDASGLFPTETLQQVRAELIGHLGSRSNEILAARGVEDPAPVSPSLALPLLHAAQDEAREELRELWARLLANARDPSRSDRVRIEFIGTLKRLHPLDALLLQHLGATPTPPNPNPRDYFSNLLKVSRTDVLVSLDSLTDNKCLRRQAPIAEDSQFYVTAYGHALIAACAP